MMEPSGSPFGLPLLTTSALEKLVRGPVKADGSRRMDDRHQVGLNPTFAHKVGRDTLGRNQSARAGRSRLHSRSLAQYCPYRPLTESNSFRESYPIPS